MDEWLEDDLYGLDFHFSHPEDYCDDEYCPDCYNDEPTSSNHAILIRKSNT